MAYKVTLHVDADTYAALCEEAARMGGTDSSFEKHVMQILKVRAADFRGIQRVTSIPNGEVDDVDTFAGLWRQKGVDGNVFQETARTDWDRKRDG